MLPACLADEIIFAVHAAGIDAFSDGKICKYADTAAQRKHYKSRHSPRKGSPEQTSIAGEFSCRIWRRCIRLGPARTLHTLARIKTNTSNSHCSPAQAFSITSKQRAARVLPLTYSMDITMTPGSARVAAFAERKSLKVKSYIFVKIA